jgi:hypothetical protein
MIITGLGIHFGTHPPETSSLDIIREGQPVIHLSLGDLRAFCAFCATVGPEAQPVVVTGDQVVEALQRMASVLAGAG